MQRWMMIVAAAGIVAAVPLAQAEAAKQGAQERGRYEGVAATDNAVWIIDTHTGRVRKCTQEFADQTPACSAYSN